MAYVALLALAALDAAGYSVVAPVLPEISERTGTGPGVAGVLVGCFAVGQLAAYPFAGRMVSRRGATWVLAASLVLVAAGDVAFALGDSLGVYLPARLVQGVGAGGLWLGVTFGVLERFPGEEYRRLGGVLAAYSVGAIGGSGMGAVGGVSAPFVLHLAAVLAAGLALAAMGRPAAPAVFGSDRAVLRTRAFRLSAAAILFVALSMGVLDGPMPLHFGAELAQAEIAAFYMAISLGIAASAAAAGRVRPGWALAAGSVALVAGLAIAGAVGTVPLWLVAGALLALGFGAGETGALGILLGAAGTERIVVAMVVWSQLWAVGYLVGPVVAGALAETAGYDAIGVIPALAAVPVVAAALARARSDPGYPVEAART